MTDLRPVHTKHISFYVVLPVVPRSLASSGCMVGWGLAYLRLQEWTWRVELQLASAWVGAGMLRFSGDAALWNGMFGLWTPFHGEGNIGKGPLVVERDIGCKAPAKVDGKWEWVKLAPCGSQAAVRLLDGWSCPWWADSNLANRAWLVGRFCPTKLWRWLG